MRQKDWGSGPSDKKQAVQNSIITKKGVGTWFAETGRPDNS